MDISIDKTIFREYDIRGIYPSQLNEKSIKLLGYFFSKQVKGEYVSIGYDARTHSRELFEYLVSGLKFGGKKVIHLGMVATGVNYFSGYQEFNGKRPSATIMITGSHNPSNYNGFKMTIENRPFFGEDIYKLGDEIILNSDLEIPNNIEYKEWNIKEDRVYETYHELLENEHKEIDAIVVLTPSIEHTEIILSALDLPKIF